MAGRHWVPFALCHDGVRVCCVMMESYASPSERERACNLKGSAVQDLHTVSLVQCQPLC